MVKLFHCSSHLFSLQVGEKVTLFPGTQNAQGIGVYFSESQPDLRASDSCYLHGHKTTFIVHVEPPFNLWYRSKRSMDKRSGRPRTWHSSGRSVTLVVLEILPENTYSCLLLS